MRDLWFLKEGFEVEIFLFLATPLPTTCGDKKSKIKNQRAKLRYPKGMIFLLWVRPRRHLASCCGPRSLFVGLGFSRTPRPAW